MNSIKELLAAEFEALKAEIITAYEASGMKASGNWAAALTVEYTDDGASITAPGYLNGRKPGKQPPSEAIEQWIKDKGIAAGIGKEISIGSLAYLIARKIGREGWQPAENNRNIVEKVATPERINAIMEKVQASAVANISGELLAYLKQSVL